MSRKFRSEDKVARFARHEKRSSEPFTTFFFSRFLYLHFGVMVIKKSSLKIKLSCGVLLKDQPGIQTSSTKALHGLWFSRTCLSQHIIFHLEQPPRGNSCSGRLQTLKPHSYFSFISHSLSLSLSHTISHSLFFLFFSFSRNHQAKGLSPRWFWGFGMLF